MTTYMTRRYYRGYSLKQRQDNQRWEIWWGELLHTSPTLEDAEKVVNEYHNAR